MPDNSMTPKPTDRCACGSERRYCGDDYAPPIGEHPMSDEQEVVMKWLNAPDPRIVHVEDRDYYRDRAAKLEDAIRRARDELGVPSDDYPAPVANAADILREAAS